MAKQLTILESTRTGSSLATVAAREPAPAAPTISDETARGPSAVLRSGASARAATPKRLPLRANFAWTLAGNVTSAACGWLIVVAIVKLGSTEMAGHYALAQAVVIPTLGFSMLQLRAVCATDAGAEYQFGHYLGLRTITTALALATMVALAFGTMNGSTAQFLILAVGLGAAVESIADVLYGGLQQRERMDWVSISMVCRSIFALATAVGVLWLTGNIIWSLLAGALAKALVLAALDLPLCMVLLGGVSSRRAARAWIGKVIFEARNLTVLSKLAWFSLPLGLVMLLLTLQTSLPRYLIDKWLDSRQLGVFSALSYAAISGTIVVNALAQAAAPRMAQHYLSRNARSYYILIGQLATLGGAIGIGGVILAIEFGRPVLAVLYAPDFAVRNDVFVWLMVAAGVNYVATFLGWGMTAARHVRIQLPLFAAIVAAMFGAGCVLVPRYGLTGAALTVLVGALVQLAGSLLVVLRAISQCGDAGSTDGLVPAETQT